MHTSLLLVALMGPGAAPTASEAPSWQTSYSAALAEGREQGKPVAVFVGRGPAGWQKVGADGLSAEARKALAANYVCVYVDATQPKGQKLATAFEIGTGTGLVLSTKDGENQAFSHDGSMSNAELERSLNRHATGAAVSRTEHLASTRVAYSLTPENGALPSNATFTAAVANVTVPGTISATVVAPGTVISATAGTHTLAPSLGSITYTTVPATTSVVGYASYAAPTVAATVYAPGYTPTYAATIAAPTFAPSYSHGYAPTYAAPSYGYGGYSYGGGGCAGGRCGR